MLHLFSFAGAAAAGDGSGMSNSVVYRQIPVLRASAAGRTSLAAFHAALVAVGLAHYNLVRLSSVIPPGTGVDATGKAPAPAGGWGDRMYCVYAEQIARSTGEQAWAGVGWVQRLDGRGGLFVEHEGGDEQAVTSAIRTSLADMVAGADEEYAAPDWVVHGVVCAGEPVCSLVIAPYEAASWTGIP
jgi:arginine decarboxylase